MIEPYEHNGVRWDINDDDELVPFVKDDRGRWKRVAWAPQPGSQEAFLRCPVFECLYEGTRGPGKTDALIMDFAQHVGQGYGPEWRGVLFRATYKELDDVISKTKYWFHRIFPAARYNEAKFFWEFADGEKLLLRHAKTVDDYWHYHGHSLPWIAWEELTNWSSPDLYLKMMSCVRSKNPKVPRKVRATCNPAGPGHNWVKNRFRLPISMGSLHGPIIRDSRTRDGRLERPRVAIHGHLLENKVLLHSDPMYVDTIRTAASSEAELRAWIHGDWDIVSGGMLDDIWRADIHVVPNVPFSAIPKTWRIDRSYDHGEASPFSVGWWAESDGSAFEWNGRVYGSVRGDLYRIAEWYGWNGRPNEGVKMLANHIASGILEREADWGIAGRVRPGPADTSIWSDESPGKTVEGQMRAANRGKTMWIRADKARKQGWHELRTLLFGALPSTTGYREKPGLFVFDRCSHFKRTVPSLPRDKHEPDDVDTSVEDHVADEVRYRVRARNAKPSQRKWK